MLKAFAAREPTALTAGLAWADVLEATIVRAHPVLARIHQARESGPHTAARLVELAGDLLSDFVTGNSETSRASTSADNRREEATGA